MFNWKESLLIARDGFITLAVLVYVAGEFTGRFVHKLNDRLAELLVAMTVEPQGRNQAASPYVWPLIDMISDYEAMTVKQLREITGIKKKAARKATLIAYCFALV